MGNIKELIKGLISDIRLLIYPGKAEEFFKKLKIHSPRYMIKYILVSGIFLFLGYFLDYAFGMSVFFGYLAGFTHPFYTSIRKALTWYLVAVSIPIVMGLSLNLFGEKLVKRKVGLDESIAIVAYSTVLGLVSGIFKSLLETWIIHILLIAYCLYLLYTAIRIRFGFEKAVSCFIFLVVVACIAVMIVFKFVAFILGLLIL